MMTRASLFLLTLSGCLPAATVPTDSTAPLTYATFAEQARALDCDAAYDCGDQALVDALDCASGTAPAAPACPDFDVNAAVRCLDAPRSCSGTTIERPAVCALVCADADTDSDANADTDSDADADTDSDADADADSDADTDADTDTSLCDSAIPIGSATGIAAATGSTYGSTDDVNGTCSYLPDGGGADDNLLWTAPYSGCFSFDTFNSSFDTLLSLHDGCDTLVELACDESFHGFPTFRAALEFEAIGGSEYLISVDGYDTIESGPWQLDITPCVTTEISCDDGIDNDSDDLIDCFDQEDCAEHPGCGLTGGNLYITEVLDGTGNVKFVEVRNGGATALSMGGFSLRKYTNGNLNFSEYFLPFSTLGAGELWVFANGNTLGQQDFEGLYGYLSNVTFVGGSKIDGNGNDAYELTYLGTTVDVYGEIGLNYPGMAWDYTDASAVRDRTVTTGRTSWLNSEWTVTPGTGSPGLR